MTNLASIRLADSFEEPAGSVDCEELGEAGTVGWVVDAERQFLGTTRLHSFREDGSARYAVGFFDPKRFGCGFGTEVTKVVVQYAFSSLALQRLDLAVLAFNERAIRCYKHCGFREVGRSSDVIVIDGEPHYDVLMEITPAALRNKGLVPTPMPRAD